MQRLPLALPLLFLPALAACPGGDGSPGFEQDAWRDDWQTVVDGAVLPGLCPPGVLGCECGVADACDAGGCASTPEGSFCVDPGAGDGNKGGACDKDSCKPGLVCVLIDESTQSVCVDPPNDEVTSLLIGGLDVNQNFINRGNVEVYFNGPEGKVSVQLRRFTFAPDEATAQASWAKLHPWIFSGSVVPPGPDIEELDCTEAFRDGCQVRVWYEGMTQPLRDGADIRVILPPSYLGNLDIVTEDNIEEGEYPDRGDVTIKGLRGTADIELDSGNIRVELGEDVLEAPACGADAVKACEDYIDPETMEAAPWSLQCGCTEFGKIRVVTRPERAANVTIDMPGDLWATARMENAQAGMTKTSIPLCTAEPDCKGIDSCEDIGYDENFPWKRTTEFNDPGDSAVEGVGYNFDLTSQGCQNVTVVEGPDDWGSEPDTENRGDLRICSGCLDLPNP